MKAKLSEEMLAVFVSVYSGSILFVVLLNTYCISLNYKAGLQEEFLLILTQRNQRYNEKQSNLKAFVCYKHFHLTL